MRQLLATVELRRHDWAKFRVADNKPLDVPLYLEGLIGAESSDAAEAHYWGLENEVVIQGQLYNSAVPVTSVIMACLCDDLTRPARTWLMELLFQIVNGESIDDETEFGNANLGDQCRAVAREGLWVLYRELHYGDVRAAKAILDVLVPVSNITEEIIRYRGLPTE